LGYLCCGFLVCCGVDEGLGLFLAYLAIMVVIIFSQQKISKHKTQ